MDNNQEYEIIQNIHIYYINYRFLKKKTSLIKIDNFGDYLEKYYKLNYNYYLELAEKYRFDTKK